MLALASFPMCVEFLGHVANATLEVFGAIRNGVWVET
jgi:hypothetical protein